MVVARKRLVGEAPPVRKPGGVYFPQADNKSIEFLPTGCTLLDCVLGGGWVFGRVANIVGDQSTGKTLLAIEACANFHRMYKKGYIWYREAEGAFDLHYAEKLGLPHGRVDFGPDGLDTHWGTVEDLFTDLHACAAKGIKSGKPSLYIVDSLDALSSRAAGKREVGADSYNLEKQKIISQQFAELIRDIREARMALIIISQVRDRIGFVMGEKHRRSGGRALDFYACHALWLNHMKTLVKKLGGAKRATGVVIRAKTKKNKVVANFRECQFTIRYGYGIEDVEASIDWMVENKVLDHLGIKVKDVDDYLDEVAGLPAAEYQQRAAELRQVMFAAWEEVERRFTSERRKY